MENSSESLDVVLPVDDQPPKTGRPIVAWVVIVLLVIFICYRGMVRTEKRIESGEDRIDLTVTELQSKSIVGTAAFWGKKMVPNAAEALNAGPVDQRFRYVVLEGELSGPTKAKDALEQLAREIAKRGIELTPEQRKIHSILKRLYTDYASDRWEAPSLSASDRELLHRELGWFGKLALNPDRSPDRDARKAVLRSAQKTMWVLTAFVGALAFLGVAGFIGLIVVLVLFLIGVLRGRFRCGTPYGGVYAETFALWMALFIILSIGTYFVPAGDSMLLVQGLASVLSLMALVWPVIRGVPWRQVRHDLGLNWGPHSALAPLLGAGGYMMTLPLLAIGVAGMFILIALHQMLLGSGRRDEFAPTDQPSHPIIEYVSGGSWWGPIQIILVASVVAPVVEETIFRGVLYRHLREASAKFGSVLSILVSAGVNSFVFAVIHPQGIVAVPVLMSLAFGFSLIREWRGTLLPCMVAHGLHNGLLTLALILAMR